MDIPWARPFFDENWGKEERENLGATFDGVDRDSHRPESTGKHPAAHAFQVVDQIVLVLVSLHLAGLVFKFGSLSEKKFILI